MLMMKCTRMFLASKGVIHVQTFWSQKVVLNVSLQKEFTKLDGLPYAFPKNVIYIAFCLSCLKQGLETVDWKPIVDWKPRLWN